MLPDTSCIRLYPLVAVNMFLVSATKKSPVCRASVAGYKGIQNIQNSAALLGLGCGAYSIPRPPALWEKGGEGGVIEGGVKRKGGNLERGRDNEGVRERPNLFSWLRLWMK